MKKLLSFFTCLVMLLCISVQAFAADSSSVNTIVSDTANCLYKTVPCPQVGTIGGEWAVMGLARSGADIPKSYYENYYQAVEKYVKDLGGVLHEKKYTEYSRVIVALTAMGKNPADVAGYNLLVPLGDYEKTIWQGVNGSVWALIALDSGNYEIPLNTNAAIQATREMYINHILENQISAGGWALSGDTADPDVTAMALQALSNYQDNEAVKAATEKALDCMSEMQNENGGFSSRETENSESNAQMIVALSTLGISLYDSRFVKNGNTVLDNLLTYYEYGEGFKHTEDGTVNQMATEQCFYALVAVKRFNEGQNSLYNMSDAAASSSSQTIGLTDKNVNVKKLDIILSRKTYGGITGYKNKETFENFSVINTINEKAENAFGTDAALKREEIAQMLFNMLSLLKMI